MEAGRWVATRAGGRQYDIMERTGALEPKELRPDVGSP